MARVQVMIRAADVLSRAGVERLLHTSPALEVVEEHCWSDAQVIVLVAATVTTADLDWLRRRRTERGGSVLLPSVIVADEFDAELTMTAVEYGVKSVLPRSTVSLPTLVSAVVGSIEGQAYLPGRLQRALIKQLDSLRCSVLEPNGFTFSGLSPREIDVLELLAEGALTDEIAERLAYSEATVKYVLYGLLQRLGLQNRTHAVAYAIRSGALRAE
jgi:DNA-binding NarL/FixJ family response regulator